MSAFFSVKTIAARLTLCLAATFVFGCFSYAYLLKTATAFPVQTSFYFLVSAEQGAAQAAEWCKLQGGAGYLLQTETETYSVLSVYFTQADGESVQAAFTAQNKPVRLVTLSAERLYFTGRNKRKAATYLSALQALKACASVLANAANLLEGGETQNRVHGILVDLQGQFFALAKTYAKFYPAFSKFCQSIGESLQTELGGVLFASRLRYLVCTAAEGYLRLCKPFQL